MQFTIREFESDDFSDIYKLNRDEMGYDFPLYDTWDKLNRLTKSSADKIYVAVVEKKVVGFVHASDYDTIYAPHMKNIMGIAVAKGYKGNGIGRALLANVEEWGKNTGAKGVRLVSGASRTEAHAFYHSCGYGEDKAQVNMRKIF